MILKVIFAQRTESYDGQYAPEAMECMTEYQFEDNPDWLLEKYDEYRKDDDFISVEIIDIEISDDAVIKALFPENRINGIIKLEVTQ